MIVSKNINSLARSAVWFASVALITAFVSAGLWSSVGWAQETARDEAKMFAQLSPGTYTLHRRRAAHPPRSRANPANEVPEDVPPESVSGGTVAAALASCDKGSERSEGLTLPGAKGEIKLDRCYRGRDQLVCSLSTLSKEAKALVDDFSKIVETNYPSVGDVEAVCSITPDDLSGDFKKANGFGARFKDLKNEYDRHVNCAMKIEQALRDVTLADMPRAGDILKSMNDALQGDMKDVAAARQQIFDLADKMDSAHKAMATIQKIHRTMCLSRAVEKSASGAPEKPVSGTK